MSSLLDRPDPNQLHTQAKELQRALAEGDEEARERVLASHPKFAGRPAARWRDGMQMTPPSRETESKLHEYPVP
jgi:2-oxo-4-hydroxy-4-carboxy--5-ureidoimidazoline (OHCU) decarboxylase